MKLDIIVAIDEKFGIGKNGTIPWNCKEDLKLFKSLTENSILIMGRKTVEKLPILPNRKIFCLTRTKQQQVEEVGSGNNILYFETATQALNFYQSHYSHLKLFVAGGERIYSLFLTTFQHMIERIHLSRIKGVYDIDTVLHSLDISKYRIQAETDYSTFKYQILIPSNQDEEKAYLSLLEKVLNQGEIRQGRNGETKSVFCEKLSFNLENGFPLLTTKKMFLRGIVEELLFFLKGQTDTKILESKGVNIWKGNTTRSFLDSLNMTNRKEGEMGPMYGFQWRFFGKENNSTGFDQLNYVIETLKSDPFSRRILMTTYNPLQAFEGVLFPCHSIVNQFYVNNNKELEMTCYNRSQDLFLGTPFNIASSALLLIIIAHLTKLKPIKLHLILGDCHIYKSHYDSVFEQIKRNIYVFPKLTLREEVKLESLKDIDDLSWNSFSLENYLHCESIKVDMVA